MRIFIDESGTFSGFHTGSIAAVGGLCIPDGRWPKIEKKYTAVRRSLPLDGDEVKGRNLTEGQIDKIISILARNEAIFEATVIDLSMHDETAVGKYKEQLANNMSGRLCRFNAETRKQVQKAITEIRATSVPLYLQAMANFDLLSNIISHIPTYFAQRQPKELGTFSWIVDGKDSAKVTNWENWWSWYAMGVLARRSKTNPMPTMIGADYSYFDQFNSSLTQENDDGIDLKLLLSDLRFSSEIEFGLELVDVVTNAVRRALAGRLSQAGWGNIPKLMIHRPHNYISLMRLEGASIEPNNPSYEPVVRKFSTGGKNMLSPKFMKLADEDESID